MTSHQWRIRPGETNGTGKPVSFKRLTRAVEAEDVGDLDEVLGPGDRTWRPLGEHPRTADLFPVRRRNRSREPEDVESDLTPMIDVTFQMIIFFMIAATYTVQKTLDLPASEGPGPATVTMEQLERDSILVKIGPTSAVTVQDEPVAMADLERRIRGARQQNRTAELVLDVDDDALHDVVVQVLDAASAAKFETVLFVSRETGD